MSHSGAASRAGAKGHGSSKRGRVSNGLKDIRIDETVKISVNLALERFRYSDQKEMEFPSSFSNTERAFVHRIAQSLGYISKSKGKGSDRYLTIRKKDGSEKPRPNMPLALCPNTLVFMRSLLQRFPVNSKERTELQLNSYSSLSIAAEAEKSQLNKSVPMVPKRRTPTEIDSFRCSLPVYQRREEIVQLIRDNRVILVVGETGSGKTTQISQFILDDCTERSESCRIFCTQPRRLAAVAVAERVAAERGESIGQTVGYHIRLESRVSPKTLLTFCTSGVFLRMLMSGDAVLNSVTHVIVDEVHERDGLTDFLLTKIRDVLQNNPALRLILSSAALDTDLFLQYFGSCPVLHIKGRLFDVKELFLEDVLKMTGYQVKDIKKYQQETQEKEGKRRVLTEWCKAVKNSSPEDLTLSASLQNSCSQSGENFTDLEPWLVTEMDSCISNIFLSEDQEAFTQIFNLILYENVNVDYTHSETGATALMVAAARGCVDQMQQLLSLGADFQLQASNGWSPLDFALHFNQMEAVDLLKSSIPFRGVGRAEDGARVSTTSPELSPEDQELLTLYHHSFDDDFVDLDLIMTLLHYICSTTNSGAILIFLPGYDEIVSLRDRILYDDKRFSAQTGRYNVFTLHSDMQTSDQKRVMKPPPKGVRKIILSTNIAETSITINDVVFVIDSGKVKEKSYDTLTHVSMLKSVWISKASALQRKGRAGRCRPGVCFHLFSRLRFSNMQEFQVPQLLRMPLQELCLQTKLLAPGSCPVAEFLCKAPQPPPAHAIRNAVQMLKTIDALDQNEDLTNLGYYLADLPVEPHLGKMVLCAVMLKCLDPILTIACTLTYRDPFVLPAQGSQKKASLVCRKRFTSGSFSDHMALLRAFQGWQKARSEGWERLFCEKNFLSPATMDMILGVRTQLLGQLRAIGFVRARGGSDIRDVNMNSENWAVVKAALVAGMYPNLVHINKDSSHMSSSKEKKLNFHPTSVLSQSQLKESSSSKSPQELPTDWLIYDEMSRGNRMASVRCCSMVTPVTIALFAGCVNVPSSTLHEADSRKESPGADLSDSDSDSEEMADLKLDDWLLFQLDAEAAGLVLELRQKWQYVFINKIKCPSKPCSQQDEAVIRALVSVLSVEEQKAGLQQPIGIGQRPRSMTSEEGPQQSLKNPRNHPHTSTTDDGVSGRSEKLVQDGVSVSECPLSPSVSSLCLGSDGSSAKPPLFTVSSLRYFIMKSNSMRNIEVSQQKGIWSTSPSTESKLSRAYVDNKTIILIFSVQGHSQFQGYARMTSSVSREASQDLETQGGVFSVEWIHTETLPFQLTQHILNPWNENRKVQMSRDGQELEPQTGSQLLQIWDRHFVN